jgi:D-arabinose 1-dehydrogenase-like Zn-dependent alcohol dehydrogenase
MRALTVEPGAHGSLRVENLPDPEPAVGELLVRGLASGVCGTDKEIVRGAYGRPPASGERMILDHEAFGRVEQAPPGSSWGRGDLAVGVRRPDSEPCGDGRQATGTYAATAATPSAASRSCPASAASGGRSPSNTACASTPSSVSRGC